MSTLQPASLCGSNRLHYSNDYCTYRQNVPGDRIVRSSFVFLLAGSINATGLLE
jgi:hypothetical protein